MDVKTLMGAHFTKGTYKGMKGWFGVKAWEGDRFGYMHHSPFWWKIRQGAVLKGELDYNPWKDCAEGIHFGTPAWVRYYVKLKKVYVVFVPVCNVDNIVWPSNQDDNDYNRYKVRTNELYLVRRIYAKDGAVQLPWDYVPEHLCKPRRTRKGATHE